MNKVKGQYIFNKGNWDVRYKVEDGDEQHYVDVMLHPNHTKHAKENAVDWFIIRDCPNIRKGGSWEPMAILVKGEDVDKPTNPEKAFKSLNEHAMMVINDLNSVTETKEPEATPSSNDIQTNYIKTLKKTKKRKKSRFLKWSKITNIVLLIGIVTLAALDKDGWGWLLFIYMIKNV